MHAMPNFVLDITQSFVIFVMGKTHVITGNADMESCWWISLYCLDAKNGQVPKEDIQESEAHVEPWRVKLEVLKSSGLPKDSLL